jgi:hypothetical protein
VWGTGHRFRRSVGNNMFAVEAARRYCFWYTKEPWSSQECMRCGSKLLGHVIRSAPLRRIERRLRDAKRWLKECESAARSVEKKINEADEAVTVPDWKQQLVVKEVKRAKNIIASLETKVAECVNDPSARVLPSTHKSRDVKECAHCGEMCGDRCINRDCTGGGNIGYRGTIERVFGLRTCPGRFHPNRTVRETSWAKIAGINAGDEAEKFIGVMNRLFEGEQHAWEKAAVDRPVELTDKLAAVEMMISDWTTRFEKEVTTSVAKLKELSSVHHKAHSERVAKEYVGGVRNASMKDAKYRRKVYEDASNIALDCVKEKGLLLEPPRNRDDVDKVVYTAQTHRKDIAGFLRDVKAAVVEVAFLLGRRRDRNKKTNSFRFGNEKRYCIR